MTQGDVTVTGVAPGHLHLALAKLKLSDANVDGHHVMSRGVESLSSTDVWSSDIRAGAGLVLAGLVADGVTTVHDVHHIDRGYPEFVENLNRLGARVERVND